MYIEIHNHLEMSQKVLYFKLNNSFNMEIVKEENAKLAGIYAIFKDGICLYVGQSKNLASRIATHIKGKYENSDYILIWNISDLGFSNFYNINNKSQEIILNNCEKFIMRELKPIENILVDFNFTLEENEEPIIFFDDKSSYIIKKNSDILVVTDGFYSFDDLLLEYSETLQLLSNINNKTYLQEYKNINKLSILTTVNTILKDYNEHQTN